MSDHLILPKEWIDGIPIFHLDEFTSIDKNDKDDGINNFEKIDNILKDIESLGIKNGIIKFSPNKIINDSSQNIKLIESLIPIISNSIDDKSIDLERKEIFIKSTPFTDDNFFMLNEKKLFKNDNLENDFLNALQIIENQKNDQKLLEKDDDFWNDLTNKTNNNSISYSIKISKLVTNKSIFHKVSDYLNYKFFPSSTASNYKIILKDPYFLSSNINFNNNITSNNSSSSQPNVAFESNLYSISYINKGGPIQWYVINDALDQKKLLDLIQIEKEKEDKNPNFDENNNNNKISINPELLFKNDISYKKITQNQYDFMITYPNVMLLNFNYRPTLLEVLKFDPSDWNQFIKRSNQEQQNQKDIKEEDDDEHDEEQENDIKVNIQSKDYNQDSHVRSQLTAYPLNSSQNASIRSTNSESGENLNKIDSNNGFSIQGNTTLSNNNFFNSGQTISRISSPLLSRMMDLSNIVEPTLEDPTLKFKKRENQINSNLNELPSITSPLNGRHHLLGNPNNSSNGQGISNTLPSLSVQQSSGNPLLLDDNDDNLLALSLASMANSGASSPRLTLLPMNSPGENSSFPMNHSLRASTLTPDAQQQQNMPTINYNIGENNNTGNNQLNNGLSGNTPLISPKPSYNTNPLAYQNSNLGNKPLVSTPLMRTASNLPYVKRLKSPNIVTLNISREGSKSPLNFNSEIKSPLGVTNPLTYSSIPGTAGRTSTLGASIPSNLSQVPIISNKNFESPSSPQSPVAKKLKTSKSNGIFNTIENSSTNSTPAGPKKKTNNSQSQTPKFSSGEVIISENGKIYVCQECKRQFSSGHHLTRHKKSVHSGEKPHSCPKCGKRFKRRDHVLQHLNKKIPCSASNDAAPVTITEPESDNTSTVKGRVNNIDTTNSSTAPSSGQARIEQKAIVE